MINLGLLIALVLIGFAGEWWLFVVWCAAAIAALWFKEDVDG